MRAVGAMSGTSMDGVDLAVIETDGGGGDGLRATGLPPPYSKAERAVIRAALGPLDGRGRACRGPPALSRTRIWKRWLRSNAGEDADVFGPPFTARRWRMIPMPRRTHPGRRRGRGSRRRRGSRRCGISASNDNGTGRAGGAAGAFPYHWALARHIGETRPGGAFLNLGGRGQHHFRSIRGWSGRSCPAPALPSTRGPAKCADRRHGAGAARPALRPERRADTGGPCRCRERWRSFSTMSSFGGIPAEIAGSGGVFRS